MARPLPELVLFLDECLGSTDVPDALRSRGIRVELLRDHFDLATRDTDWLAEVGRRGWVVLTKDQRIRRRRVEFNALLAANVAAFVLTSGNLTGAATGHAFVQAWPKIQKHVRDFSLPFVAAVDARGKRQTAHTCRAIRGKEEEAVTRVQRRHRSVLRTVTTKLARWTARSHLGRGTCMQLFGRATTRGRTAPPRAPGARRAPGERDRYRATAWT